MENILISFVLPAYKEMYLSKAIESILHQTYPYWELIIVDDASPEPISIMINQYKDKRIKYIRNKTNIGKTNLIRNWNNCITYAHGEYIILASDDDMYNQYFLEEVICLIQKYPEISIIRSGVKKIDGNDNIIDVDQYFKEFISGSEFTYSWSKGQISCIGNYVFKKNKLTEIGGFVSFPKGHYSDDATALTLSKQGIACTKDNTFYFRVSTNNLSNNNDKEIIKEQFIASQQFINWFYQHIYSLPDWKDFAQYKKSCFENYRRRYIVMLDKLSMRLPISNLGYIVKRIKKDRYLYNKEKLIFIIKYLIYKL